MRVLLKNVRCSYVYITSLNKQGKHGMQVLIEKGSPEHEKVKEAIDAALVSKFGADALKKKGRYKLPLRDGDDERDGEEYEGHMFFNANATAKKPPGIVNRFNRAATPEDHNEMGHSGCYFHVMVEFYGFEPKDGGKAGIAAGLNNVMLRKVGERLDGGISAEKAFADFADDAGDDFGDDVEDF